MSLDLKREPPVPADVLAAVRAPFQAFGGTWSSAPVLQPLSALMELAGEAIRARLFVVQGEGGGELALRPDFTIALARAHIASGVASARNLYEGEAFRTAPRGSDRPSEFVQIGVEAFGETGDAAGADAQVAALAWNAALAGGRRDLTMVMGDVALFDAFLRAVDLPVGVAERLSRAFAGGRPLAPELDRLREGGGAPVGGRLSRLLSELPEAEASAVLEELWSLAGIQPVGGRGAGEVVHRLIARAAAARAPRLSAGQIDLVQRYLAIDDAPERALAAVRRLAPAALDPSLDAWGRRLAGLAQAGGAIGASRFCTGFVRPFGYYDGLLFEVRSAALSADEPVAAGGRSDGLLARLGGAAQPSVGCMVRPYRAWSGSSQGIGR